MTVSQKSFLVLCRSPYPLTDFCTASEHLRRTRGTNFLKSFPRYVFVNAAYHDFVDSNPRKKSSRQNQELRKPDLVLALNCGFVFYKEWDASLPSMVTFANVPLIFTEYYQEDCKLDLQKLGLSFSFLMSISNLQQNETFRIIFFELTLKCQKVSSHLQVFPEVFLHISILSVL